jgi:hypothetical protein
MWYRVYEKKGVTIKLLRKNRNKNVTISWRYKKTVRNQQENYYHIAIAGLFV